MAPFTSITRLPAISKYCQSQFPQHFLFSRGYTKSRTGANLPALESECPATDKEESGPQLSNSWFSI